MANHIEIMGYEYYIIPKEWIEEKIKINGLRENNHE